MTYLPPVITNSSCSLAAVKHLFRKCVQSSCLPPCSYLLALFPDEWCPITCVGWDLVTYFGIHHQHLISTLIERVLSCPCTVQ